MYNLLNQLKRDEGYRADVYRDTEGLLTIGYGHCLDRKGISLRVAELMLDDDIADAKAGLMGKWPWVRDLSPARLGAMVNLTFNMGVGGLNSFKKFLAAAERGDWATAAAELLDSKYAKQVGERAQRVATQLREDRWV